MSLCARNLRRAGWFVPLLLSAGLLLAQDTGTPADAAAPPPEPESAPTRVDANQTTQAPEPRVRARLEPGPVGVAEKQEKQEKPGSSRWEFSWQGWNGLHIELWRKTHLANPLDALGLVDPDLLPIIHLEQVKFSATLGARLDVDGAAFRTTGDLTGFDDGVQLRRARINFGGDAILFVPFRYEIQIGYVPSQFNLHEAFLNFPNIKWIGSLQLGQFQPPMGLDLITSSWSIALMEPAAPLQAIAPPIEAGAQVGEPFANRRATWFLGAFGPGAGSEEYGSVSSGFGNALGRVTWLPFGRLDPEHPSANRFLHLGLSVSSQYASSGTIRYQARPESYIAPFVIDTGDITSSSVTTAAAEVAWVNGPFSVQSEFLQSFVGRTNSSSLRFGGFYAEASWFLTGETPRYDPETGAFGRPVPLRNFSFRKGEGWGALEVAVRYSHTDLNDQDVHGGLLKMWMTGLNWYLQPHLKWMFNYGRGSVSGGASQGDMSIFQARVGVDF